MQSPFAAKIGTRGISQPQWRALLALWQKPNQSIGDLSALAGIEISTLSRTVAGLAERGLVKRTRLPTDARTVIASLTETGRELTSSLLPAARDIERTMLAGVTPEQEALIRSALGTILGNLHHGWNTRETDSLVEA